MSTKIARQQLLQLLCKVQSLELMNELLETILSDKELEGIENRIQILKLVSQNKSQREIASVLSVSIATVTRGAKAYRKSNLVSLIEKLENK